MKPIIITYVNSRIELSFEFQIFGGVIPYSFIGQHKGHGKEILHQVVICRSIALIVIVFIVKPNSFAIKPHAKLGDFNLVLS